MHCIILLYIVLYCFLTTSQNKTYYIILFYAILHFSKSFNLYIESFFTHFFTLLFMSYQTILLQFKHLSSIPNNRPRFEKQTVFTHILITSYISIKAKTISVEECFQLNQGVQSLVLLNPSQSNWSDCRGLGDKGHSEIPDTPPLFLSPSLPLPLFPSHSENSLL